VKSSHSLDRLDVAFDDHRLTANAGLLLPATLGQHLGLEELFDEQVDLGGHHGGANVGRKAMTLVASALVGGDCIDDADALRAGGTDEVLGHRVAAPSTLGTFMRAFTWGHARQMDAVLGEALKRGWAAGAGPGEQSLTIDLDSTICETYGLLKAGGSKFTYNHVRGYHPLVAVVSRTGDVCHSRLRGGSAHAGRGAASFLGETVQRVRRAGAAGPLTMRADSGFYNHKVVGACRQSGVRFSISVKMYSGAKNAIAAIPDSDWTPIPYFLEGAEVAETTYTPFASQRGQKAVRLIVRRVRPTPGSQLDLFGVPFSYHAFITDRDGETLALEADHRRHAEVENTIRDLKYGVGLNHLPSGRFGANAVWLALNVLAHNLARWVSRIGLGEALVTTKRLRFRYLSIPGRLTYSGRRWRLHLPQYWPWADTFIAALERLCAIPLRA
jgi:Transposase DDE domain group 1